jgi:hypothetical protein
VKWKDGTYTDVGLSHCSCFGPFDHGYGSKLDIAHYLACDFTDVKAHDYEQKIQDKVRELVGVPA